MSLISRIIVCVVLLNINYSDVPGQLIINEVMSSNSSAWILTGESPDWIELQNTDNTAISLIDYALSDDSTLPEKWQFPDTVIEAGEYLVILADGATNRTGSLNCSFKLAAGKEAVFLYRNRSLIDNFPAFESCSDLSYGRNAAGNLSYFLNGSPGLANETAVNLGASIDINISHKPGFYTQPIALNMQVEAPLTIRYSLEASVPTKQHPDFSNAIQVSSATANVAAIDQIEIAEDWNPPSKPPVSATLLTHRLFYDTTTLCPARSSTYLINDRAHSRYSLPVLSVSSVFEHLFSDSTGIYVLGDDLNYLRYGRDWERPASLEYFDAYGRLLHEQNIGLRLHGVGARQLPQKSLRLVARSQYGEPTFDFPFFGGTDSTDKRKTLVLRSPQTDWGESGMRDYLATALVSDMELLVPKQRPVILLLNGVYWGIYYLREHIDEKYLDEQLNQTFDLLENSAEVKEGNRFAYDELIGFVSNADLNSNEFYEDINRRIHLDNFIDYHTAHIFFANVDWPDNNVRYFKAHADSARWNWLFFDSDASFWRLGFDLIAQFTPEAEVFSDQPKWSTFLLKSLLNNPQFRARFNARFHHHLRNTFSPKNSLNKLERIQELLIPHIEEQINRWHYPKNENAWKNAIEDLQRFLMLRPGIVKKQLNETFGSTLHVNPNPADCYIQLSFIAFQANEAVVQISNLAGQQVYSSKLSVVKGENRHRLNTTSLSSGNYLLSVEYGSIKESTQLSIIGK